MTSAVPPTAVAPAIVPHQPPSLKDLSSSEPTSVTPPIRKASPLSGSPQAARPVGASLALGASLSAVLPAGCDSAAWDALSPVSLLHAARVSIRMASTAIIELECFRICFLHTIRWCALPQESRRLRVRSGPWAPGAESAHHTASDRAYSIHGHTFVSIGRPLSSGAMNGLPERVRLVIFDLDGVVYRGSVPVPGAPE